MKLWPSSKEMGDPPGAYGREIKATEGTGFIDDGNIAYPERVAEARRRWLEAMAEDFEPVGRRRMRDRATDVVYVRVPGAPLMGEVHEEAIDVWYVEGGKLVFLLRESRVGEATRTVVHGAIRGGQVVDGRIVWES